MFNRPDKVRRTERVVDDERYAVTVRHGGYGLDVQYVAVRVAESLCIDRLRLRTDGALDGIGVINLYNGVRNALRGQCVGDQVERAAVEIVGDDDMVA